MSIVLQVLHFKVSLDFSIRLQILMNAHTIEKVFFDFRVSDIKCLIVQVLYRHPMLSIVPYLAPGNLCKPNFSLNPYQLFRLVNLHIAVRL